MPTDLARTPVLYVLCAVSNLTTQISQTRFGAERKMKPMISRVVGTLAAALLVVSPTNSQQNEGARALGDVAREQQLERKQKAKTGGTVHIDIVADPNKAEPNQEKANNRAFIGFERTKQTLSRGCKAPGINPAVKSGLSFCLRSGEDQRTRFPYPSCRDRN